MKRWTSMHILLHFLWFIKCHLKKELVSFCSGLYFCSKAHKYACVICCNTANLNAVLNVLHLISKSRNENYAQFMVPK